MSLTAIKGQHVKGVGQWDRPTIDALIESALALAAQDDREERIDPVLAGMVMSTLFYENSSRTYCSFVAAMQKLGGSVVNLPLEKSSVSKGETLSDTIRTVDAYSNVIVLRHPEVSALETATSVAKAPIMNAGNGTGEHPTQALLDLVTIKAELGRIRDLHVVLVGDLKHGRTVHSLAKVLLNFENITFTFVAPEMLAMPDSVVETLRAANATVNISTALTEDIVKTADVIYVTRVQKERFPSEEAYEAVKNSYVVNKALMAAAKPPGQMTVMHPLPRNDELATDFDEDPRAGYFRQMRYGLFARMALLKAALGK